MSYSVIISAGLVAVSLAISVVIWLRLNRRVKKIIARNFSGFPKRRTNYADFTRNFDLACVGADECSGCFDLKAVPEVKGFNWGLPGQSMEQTFWIIKHYFGLLKRGGALLVFVSPITLFREAAGRRDVFIYNFFLDRNFLHLEPSVPFDFRDWVVTNVINRGRRDRIYERASDRFPLLYPFATYNLLKDMRREGERLRGGRGGGDQAATQALREITELEMSGELERRRESNAKTLLEMVDFIRQRAITPVMVVPPVPSAVMMRYPSAFLADHFYPVMMRVKKAGAIMLDYTQESDFAGNAVFSDAITMKPEHRWRFTRRVISDLRKTALTSTRR